MCGLTGFWRPSGLDRGDEDVLRAMNNTLCHRGPDDAGYWTDGANGVALAHRRLSILDLSSEGHQPKQSASGRFMLVLNGEIYNFRDLREQLRSHGHSFKGTSDTEVLLAAFEQWGIVEGIGRCTGMFAIAVWDGWEKRLWLVRDRLGEKPMYYGWRSDTLLFGSELKALRAHPQWSFEIDRIALAGLLRYSYVPGPRSIYTGISKLAPGSAVSWTARDAGGPGNAEVFWSADEVARYGLANPFDADESELADKLDSLLRRVIGDEMVADVPLGAFLSGGIDSSVIVGVMQAIQSRPVRTFTIGFHEEAYDEARHARAVAKHLGTDHTEMYVTPDDARNVIPRLPQLFDEPFADASQIPTFLVAELARRHVTVSLSGDGGDELFGGYTRYAIGSTLSSRLSHVPAFVRRGAAAGVRAMRPGSWDRVARAAGPLLPRQLHGVAVGDKLHKLANVLSASDRDAVYRSLVSHWDDAESVVLHSGATVPNGASRALEDADVVSRMMFADAVSYLPDDILVKVDRATMAVSLESRAPFLHHDVFEFAWRVPMRFKRRGGVGKWLLRQVLYRYVPKSLVERPKMGFGVPLDSWLRGPLRDWAETLLAEDRLDREGLFDPVKVRERWREHQQGTRNWQYLLWDVLMFQAWHEAA